MDLRKKLKKLEKDRERRRAAARGPGEDKATGGRDWPIFRGLSDEKIEKKLARFPEDETKRLYIQLEREMGFRIDPENYKRHKIIKNFMTLWRRKIEDEQKKPTEKWIPLTEKEMDRIFSTSGKRGSRISE